MIVAAVEKDGHAIQDITVSAGVFEPAEVETVAELWNEYLQKGPQTSGYYFIVYRDGEQVLGYACYGPRALTEGTYDLYWIAVDRTHHRHGVGQALLRQVEHEVHYMGGRLIVVETSSLERYAPTRRFYEASGYLREATLRDFYKPGDDLVIFTKHLSTDRADPA
jgi:ribosomal protein S18 acetylase RimI-like enzyme